MVEVATGKPVWALGFMSGTSMDGVDAALVKTDGETVSEFGASAFWPFDDEGRRILGAAMAWANGQSTAELRRLAACGFAEVAQIEVARQVLAAIHTTVAAAVFVQAQHHPDLDGCGVVVGMHGQTLVHRPEEGFTLQLLFDLSEWSTNPVVSDFRSQDVAAGGEGAPLVPFYHFALAKRIAATEPVAFLNIGGVANVTWVDPAKAAPSREGACLAFDTGPGNALVNDWMEAHTGAAMDEGGAAAAAGRVHRDRLSSNAAAAYLGREPPKSLDRNDFAAVLAGMEGLSVADGAATLSAFTADCVAEAVKQMPSLPSRWLVCGGGRKNATMMAMLAERLEAPVEAVEAVGLDGDMLEAQAFAYLAVRVLRGLPTSAPGTTGCREPVSGGRISYP